MMFACIFTIYLMVADSRTEKKINYALEENHSGSFIKVTDNYDRNGYESFFEFMEEKDSLTKLQSIYNELKKSEILDYYEFAEQPVELTGEYKFSDQFIYNDEVDLKNQEISYENGRLEHITPVKSIQIGKETLDKLEVAQYFSDDIELTEADFIFEDGIPVVLGYNYKEYCKVGDVIEGIFLTQNINFVVKGFFDKDGVLSFNDQTYDLNNVFFIPLGNYAVTTENEDDDAELILYSVKNAGYLHYDSVEDYADSVRELERLAEKYQLEYTFIPDTTVLVEKENRMPSSVLACIIFNLALFIILFSMGKDYLQEDSHKKLKCIKYIIMTVLLFAVSLYFACNISMYYFRYTIFLILFLQKINILINEMIINYIIALIIFFIILKRREKA